MSFKLGLAIRPLTKDSMFNVVTCTIETIETRFKGRCASVSNSKLQSEVMFNDHCLIFCVNMFDQSSNQSIKTFVL